MHFRLLDQFQGKPKALDMLTSDNPTRDHISTWSTSPAESA